MPTPRVIILRAPGTNCDIETAFAFEQCSALVHRVHLNRVLEQPDLLNSCEILCIPGGFSYGDDVGAGAIFGQQLRNRLADQLHQFLQADKLILGICNGFQVLMRSGVLPGGEETWPPQAETPRKATLTWNDSGRFTARWVHLRTAGSPCVFLRGIEKLELPIAHAEGKIVCDDETLTGWQARRQIALCYTQADGETTDKPFEALEFPHNPNGSRGNIAGLCDATGRVFGLMPHPERHLHSTQHPQWTRRKARDEAGDGLQLFRNAVDYFE